MAKFSCSAAFFCVLVLCALLAVASQEQEPAAIIRASNDKILEIYTSSPQIDREVQQRIFTIMEEVTDFAAMAERATSGFCEPSDPGSCGEFKQVFIELLQQNAIRKLGSYRADRFDYLGEEIAGDSAIIRTIAHYQQDSMELDYVLEKIGSKWRIVNYVSDGIDTIQNYRRQFSRLLGKGSLPDLILRLKKRNAEYQMESNP